jgi:hypothetical protein
MQNDLPHPNSLASLSDADLAAALENLRTLMDLYHDEVFRRNESARSSTSGDKAAPTS